MLHPVDKHAPAEERGVTRLQPPGENSYTVIGGNRGIVYRNRPLPTKAG